MSDVFGLFGWHFTDFGQQFQINDKDGEEYNEQFIGNISTSNGITILETLDKKVHNLETNDLVQFSQVQGMTELNGQVAQVNVISSYSFSIDLDASAFSAYQMAGIFKQLKKVEKFDFESLAEQLHSPQLTQCDLSEEKFSQSVLTHLALRSLHKTFETNQNGFDQFLQIANQFADEKFKSKFGPIDQKKLEKTCKVVYLTKESRYPPLCAFFGGLAAQEALKSITNKFTPIKQWFHLDSIEAFEINDDLAQVNETDSKLRRNDRFDNLRECFGGEKTLEKLRNSKLFMVGCGAIGCEMLKNYAMLGIGTGDSGLISVTDHDLIEKSNLNRQFLFREEDIQKSKSISAMKAIHKINHNIAIKAHEKKICPQTENELFTDEFFQSQDLCVNALDNVEARRYMDTRCVSNQRPLIETGTLGPKGN